MNPTPTATPPLVSHHETIICPQCSLIQEAAVVHWWPRRTYIHTCTGCKHVINESEWQLAEYPTPVLP